MLYILWGQNARADEMLTSKNSGKLKQYFHAEFFEEIPYDVITDRLIFYVMLLHATKNRIIVNSNIASVIM